MVIFGAAGDLTKRLLIPALYNLACEGLLPRRFAILGMARRDLDTESFRSKMSESIREFSTRSVFDPEAWERFVEQLYYVRGSFDDAEAYLRLRDQVEALDEEYRAEGNRIYYMATPPSVFGTISSSLEKIGYQNQDRGWKRMIVEKPFGHDLESAMALNREILRYWEEDQVYRIDHYMGKETVQNILAFRFANGIFEPLWNNRYVDHVQFTVGETVGVEGRGNYYEQAGVLRDMIQNHMFQMLAYLCMEPPSSFRPEAIRNEKAKILDAVRVMTEDEVRKNCVRGQYGAGTVPGGGEGLAYREEPGVDPRSKVETFAAVRLQIDNWRWADVPIYLRSGKRLGKRDTEILVEFKKAPDVIFRDTAVEDLSANQLLFHIQPEQGIELRFQAKIPGVAMRLQNVNMHFGYPEAFSATRGTGYEIMIYDCLIGDSTLFSRTDLVEQAWRIAQPMLDVWREEPAPEFPSYPTGSWGPEAAFHLLERDGRRWIDLSGGS